ncbi:hypothetical protein O0L34_g13776 [Tuta absoluta]|nr:hypothetical protein O0L34_g13776 [Tuta absoluta]
MVTNYIQQDIEEIKQYNDTTANHQESILAVLPFAHIYGLSLILLHKLSIGAKIISLPKFNPHMKIHKVSLLYAAPPIVLFLSSSSEIKENHLDSLNKIVNGAAAVSRVDVEKVMKRTRQETQFVQVYGSTESALVTTLKIIDLNGQNVGFNQVGELLIRGPQIMKGYRHNQEATEASFTEDGWYKSGDIAKILNDGSIQIVDRIKELIKVKGYQVSPVELENVLKEHPSVLDAGVTGVPDHWHGEVPKAFVVLKEGLNVNKGDIKNFVNSRVAEYKAVKHIVFLKNLPKSPSGKLLRRALKESNYRV